MAERTRSGSVRTSCPAIRTVPASGTRSVDRMFTVVVLPAPLGPSSARTVPRGTARSMPSRTPWSPKLWTRPRTSIPRSWAGVMGVVVTVSPSVVVGGGSGPAQENVAVAGGCVDLEGVRRFARALRALELAADHPVPCLDVEPGGAAVRDTDLELAVRGLGGDRPTAYGVQPD